MEWNLPELIIDNNFLQTTHAKSTYCVCCLAKDVQYVSLKNCVHHVLLHILFEKIEKDDLVCLRCHKVLQNFHKFKLQVEESIRLMSHQINLPNIKKLHSFQTTNIDIYNTPSKDELQNTTDIDVYNTPSKDELENTIDINIYNTPSKDELENTMAELPNFITNCENIVFKIERRTDSAEDNLCDNIEMEVPKIDIKEELSEAKLDLDSNMIKPIILDSTKSNNKQSKKSKRKKNYIFNKLNEIENMFEEEQTDFKLSSVEEDPSNLVAKSVPTNNRKFSCEQCGRLYRWRCHLERHVAAVHVTCSVACEHCPKAFKNKLALSRHIQSIHEKKYITSSSPVQCPICSKIFKLKKTLHVHLKKIHKPDNYKEEERYCVECNKLFKSKCNYQLHLSNSLKHAADKYECHDCGKKFTRKGNLTEHIQRLHLKKKRYACGVCGKQFYKQYLRRSHELHNHLGVPRERSHVCAVCGKGYSYSQVLKRHLVIHSGEKPYQCRHCPSSFTQNSALTTHCKSKHKDVTQ